jgi:hypothetical protein
VAIMPKCPLCWIALVSAVGLSWPISSGWLRSLTIAFSLVPLGLLLSRAHRSRDYRPLLLGLIAAIALYVFKFRIGLDVGVYSSAAALFGATLWSTKSLNAGASDISCRCFPLVNTRRESPHSCRPISRTSSEVLDG